MFGCLNTAVEERYPKQTSIDRGQQLWSSGYSSCQCYYYYYCDQCGLLSPLCYCLATVHGRSNGIENRYKLVNDLARPRKISLNRVFLALRRRGNHNCPRTIELSIQLMAYKSVTSVGVSFSHTKLLKHTETRQIDVIFCVHSLSSKMPLLKWIALFAIIFFIPIKKSMRTLFSALRLTLFKWRDNGTRSDQIRRILIPSDVLSNITTT